MKTSFKKVVSVLLSVLMLVSFCTVAFTTVSAEETVTHYDLGVTSGSNLTLYDDPTGTGEKVLRISTNSTRPNFELSDPNVADGKTKFEPVAGTVYTVKFDYYLSSESTATGFDFTLYYGGTSEYKVNYNTKVAIEGVVSGRHNAFIGDNQWHTCAISFRASEQKGYLNGEADSILPYLYLTYYTTNPLRGYLKNIEIITETATSADSTNESYTLDKYFNEDGSPNTTKYFKGDTISTSMPDSFINEKGEKVFVPTIDTYYSSSQSNARASDFIAVIDNSGNYLPAQSGRTYNFILKYKVLKLNDAGTHVAIGFGRASTAAGKTVPILSKKITATSDEWQYLTGTITPNSTTKLHIYLAGTGAQIVIDHIEYTTSASGNTLTQAYYFNDNGDLHIRGQYPGTDFAVNYKNEQNAAMGENIMGWYTTPDFACGTPVTKVPDTAATLYARYPSTIIDYNHRTNFASGSYGATITTSRDAYNGTMTATYAQYSGMMIPSYDANINVTTAIDDSAIDNIYGNRYAAFYQFKEGTKYRLTFVYTTETPDKSLKILFANRFQSGGVRDTGGETQVETTVASANGEYVTASYEFTHDPRENSSGTKIYSYYSGENDDITALALRTTSSGSFSITFDKIIITELTQENFENYGLKASATLNYNDGETSDEVIEFGYKDIIEFPIPEREGYVFAGWFSNYRLGNHTVSTDDIPVNVIRGSWDLKDKTYTAQWVSNETVRVDFSETPYTGTMSGNDKGGAFSIVTDETIDAESTDNAYALLNAPSASNIYKVSLFDDNGTRMYAMEGVTYRFTIRYKVTNDKNGTNLSIGVGRSRISGYAPAALDTVHDTMSTVVKSKATDSFVTATADLSVKNVYDAGTGVTESGFGILRQQLCLRINTGVVYVDYVEVTPISYTPEYALYVDNADVAVDYQNKTFTITPHDGYELKVGSVASHVNYPNYTIVPKHTDENNKEVAEKCFAEDKVVTKYTVLESLDNGHTYSFSLDDVAGDRISSLVFTADIVKSGTTTNAGFIAVSRREVGTDTDGKYQSAGIRFRSRFSASTVNAATEIGFVILPKVLLDNAGVETVGEYKAAVAAGTVATDRSVSGVVYNAADETHVIYKQLNGYYDYQAVLTGLTSADGKTDLTSLDMSIAAYIKDAEGNVTYLELGTAYSHSDIPAASN